MRLCSFGKHESAPNYVKNYAYKFIQKSFEKCLKICFKLFEVWNKTKKIFKLKLIANYMIIKKNVSKYFFYFGKFFISKNLQLG